MNDGEIKCACFLKGTKIPTRNKSAQRADLYIKLLSVGDMEMKKVSVIIPMYNSEKFLESLFEYLNQCAFQDGDEVIIVDNGSTDNSSQICQVHVEARPELYKLFSYVEKADSYASRNFGVRQATGDVFAFIDSDCKPMPQWLETVRHNINDGEVMAGEIRLEVLNNGIWELYDSVAHLTQCEVNAKQSCVATANMAVNAKDFFDVGNFAERFSGGDFEWSRCAATKGKKIVYHPEAFVYHPSRKTYEEIRIREERVAYGRGKHHKNEGGKYASLLVAYLLRIFKLSTQFRYAKEMRRRGASHGELLRFHLGFLWIRWRYVVFATRGFYGTNPRKYGVK